MKVVLKALAGTVVAGAVVFAGAPSAFAAPRHVGIVVRYATGRVSAGCTTVGGNGLQVLERKHTVIMGTQQYSGFVLKIDGVGTSRPDNTHYWSYWHSSGNGAWSYANTGAASYTPRAGTVEGWSYVNGQTSAPRPRSYTYAALCGHLDPAPAAKATPKPTTTAPSPAQSTAHTAARVPTAPSHRRARSSSAPTTSTRSGAHLAPPPPAGRHRSHPAHPSTATTTPQPSTAPHHPSSAAAAAAASTTPRTSAAPSPVAQSTAESGSTAWPTIGAAAVVAVLGVAAWLVARRRTG